MHLPRLVLLSAALALSTGCAVLQRDNYVRQQTGDFVYETPIERVWPEVSGLLTDSGYYLVEDPDTFVIQTEWRETMAASQVAASWTRYVVQGARLDAQHCAVRILREEKNAAERLNANPDAVYSGLDARGRPIEESGGMSANMLAYLHQHNQGDLKRASTDPLGNRDFAMELALIKRVEPQSAERIARQADDL